MSRPVLAATAFALNLGWEQAHWPLYDGSCGPPERRMRLCLRAAAVDAALVTAVAEAADRVACSRTAGLRALLRAGALAATAVAIEVRALAAGRWAYGARMPLVGPIGLSPLAQLPLTGAVAAAAARRAPGG